MDNFRNFNIKSIGIVIRLILILSILGGFIPAQSNTVQASEVNYAYADTFRFPLDGNWNSGIGFGANNPDPRFVGRKHLGEDYIVPAETPVYAVANGLVKHNQPHSLYMNVILIEHRLPDGTLLTSVNAHMKPGGVAEGTEVQKGQYIGTLDTAQSFADLDYPPHLHFGLRKGAYSPTWVYYGYETGSETTSNWYWPTTFINNHSNPVQTDPTIPPFIETCDNALGQVKGPLQIPTPFLYLPYQAEFFDVSIWNSQMDHSNPTYEKDGYFSGLGEKLSFGEHHPKFDGDTQTQMQGGTWSWRNRNSIYYPWNVTPPLGKGDINYYQSPILAGLYEYYDSEQAYRGYDGHDGHDFGVGGNALAAAAGTVIYARDSGNALGRVVMIYHPQGYVTSYAHLASFNVNVVEGYEITQPGEVIGVIGGSGRSKGGPLVDNYWGIHLHFTVYHWNEEDSKWRVTDPFGWDPWQSEQAQTNDPLKLCNGEVSYLLWAGGMPMPIPYTTNANTEPVVNGDVNSNGQPANDYYLGGSLDEWMGGGEQTNDQASFVADVTIPDGTIVSPGQSLTKTWRMKNAGTSTWGSGYKLVFISGEQMGAPSETNIPDAALDQAVDLSVSLTAPTAGGEHTGYFQLRNPQGTYFGPKIWVKINVQTQNAGGQSISLFDVTPLSPSSATQVHIVGRIHYFTDFRSMRFAIGNEYFEQPNLRQVGDQLEISMDWQTGTLPRGPYSILFEVASNGDLNWSSPERQIVSYILEGSPATQNRPPDRPVLSSPYNWYLKDSSGNPASVELCVNSASDPDGNSVSYWFEVKDQGGGVYASSGWIGNTCWAYSYNPNTYSWRVKTGDGLGESDWSTDTWNFTVAKGGVYIGDISFYDVNTNDTHICVPINYDGIQGPEVYAWLNEANDGSENGEWHLLDHYGPNTTPDCTQLNVHGFWIRSPEFETGNHLLKVTAVKRDSGANQTKSTTYSIPFIRPSQVNLLTPSSYTNNGTWWNTTSINFDWNPSLRTDYYALRVSTSTDPWSDANPVLDTTIPGSQTSFSYTFSQDYPKLYWRLKAINTNGVTDSDDMVWFGIDRVIPTCQIEPLPNVSFENVFQVNWSGSDNSSGLLSFDVQYKDSDRDDWKDLVTHQKSSRAYELFNGQPGHTYTFRCRAIDFAGNVGNFDLSGTATVKIDPAGRPAEPWWSADYAAKRSVTILNNMPSVALPANYPAKLVFTSGTTPSAAEIYNASMSVKKCDDLRVVYDNGQELNRFVRRCTPDEVEIWFRTVLSIPASSSTTAYQLYLSNAAAVNPPEDPAQIWYPSREGDTTNLYLFQEGGGSTALDYSGNGRNCTINPSVGWSTAKWGSGLNFQNANNGNTISLTCGSPYPIYSLTAELWFKSDSSFYNSDGRIAGQLGPNNQLSWLLSIESSKLKFERWCNGGSQQARGTIDLHREPYLSQWNHIAVTFDGGNQVKFYVNGALDNAVTLNDSCNATFNIPLEIGSVEGMGQGYYTIGAFKLSNSVKTDFYPGSFSNITNEPSTAVGLLIFPPQTGQADLFIEALSTFPNPSGGVLVQAEVRNIGSASTINGFYTDLYLNHLPVGNDDLEGSVEFWVNDPIPAGATATLTTVITDLGALGINSSIAGEETTGVFYAQADSIGSLNEPNEDNNVYADGVQVCLAASDAYEANDNSPFDSDWLTGTQEHNFNRPEDEDWLKLAAIAGESYHISTSNLGLKADTYLYLYDQDGVSLLASNDDEANGLLTSGIDWVAPADGTYFLLVKQWNPSFWGCGTSYSISFGLGNNQEIYLPFITGIPEGQWQAPIYESFEGVFPGGWTITDNPGLGYQWKDRDCGSSAGYWGGWAVGGGTNGLSLTCGSEYPNNVDTWMAIGPVDLSDASRAELIFDLWLNTEPGYDFLSWGASEDGANFSLVSESGDTNGWVGRMLDLSNVDGQSFIGKPQVWIAFKFNSDYSITKPVGVLIDQIILWRCVGGVCN